MDIDLLVTDHLRVTFGAAEAYRNDPLFHTQVRWLRDVITRLDAILDSEGIDELRRLRIARSVLAHVLEDPRVVHHRIIEFAEKTRLLGKREWPGVAD